MPLFSISIFFYTFVGLSQIYCQISIYYEHYNTRFLDLYFQEFSAAFYFPCSNSSLRIGVNGVIFAKIPHEVKLYNISTAIRTKKNKNVGPCIRAIFHIYCCYNFNPKVKCDHRSKFSNLSNWKVEA